MDWNDDVEVVSLKLSARSLAKLLFPQGCDLRVDGTYDELFRHELTRLEKSEPESRSKKLVRYVQGIEIE